MATTDTKPSDKNTVSSVAELTELLKKAAYFTLYSMPNPSVPNTPVISLHPPGITQVGVNERLHRYPIDIAEGVRVGEAAASVAMHWTPIPEAYVPVPGVAPPPTLLANDREQPFETLNGTMTYDDEAHSGNHAFGHGRTFPLVVGSSAHQLHLGTVVNVLDTFGKLSGLQGNVLVNGNIKPPVDLSLCIVARFMDPEDKLKADPKKLEPLQNSPNPDPAYGLLMVLAEVDPASPVRVSHDAAGNATWHANEILRLVNIDWDVQGPLGLRSSTTEGAIVGTYKAKFTLSQKSPSAKYESFPLTTEDGILTFTDRAGKEIGTIQADLALGDAFEAKVPGATPYRFGGAGPILNATGDFEGAMGIMTAAGAFTVKPHATLTLYILRMYDPDGEIRSAMKDAWGLEQRVWPKTSLTDQDEVLVGQVDSSLRNGRELLSWFESKDKDSTFADRFEVVQTYNPAEESYGFFDEAKLSQGAVKVMGVTQQNVFDQPKTAVGMTMKQQLREYVLHYFMRSTDYLVPEAYGGRSFGEPPPVLSGLLWKSSADPGMRGFGYSQWYYKTVTGAIGKFDEENRYRIRNLTELGETFEWIVLKVQLFNFKVPFKPFGNSGPQFVLPLQEETYIVLSKDFIVDRPGAYGLGYALLKGTSAEELLAYGPGHFVAGFKTIHFEMDSEGTTRCRMAFTVNRPDKVMNIPMDPVGIAYRFLNAVTLGAVAQFAASLQGFLPAFITPTGIDPVQAYIALANGLSGGAAGEHFGISKTELERFFLIQHFQQHYQMVTGAIATYRGVADWLAAGSLPEWIRTGVRRIV